MKQPPSLQLLQTFLLIVQRGTFTAAANSLGLTKAAVSKQLRELEQKMGLRLIERTTRSLSLTDEGRELYQHTLHLAQQLQEIEEISAKWRQQPRGTLRLFGAGELGKKLLLPLLPRYLELYPEVHVEVEFGERFPSLLAEKLDLAVGLSHSAPPNLVQKRLGETQYLLCGAPGYFEKWGYPQTAQELHTHRHIVHSGREKPYQILFTEGAVTIAPYVTVNSVEAMVTLAEQAVGIIDVHRESVEEQLDAGTLVRVLEQYKRPVVPVYVWMAPRSPQPAKVRCLLDLFNHKERR